jgi:hypothetical protein
VCRPVLSPAGQYWQLGPEPPVLQCRNWEREGASQPQELVDLFNFHRFDNMRHSEQKLDPRRESFEVFSSNSYFILLV